MEYLQTSNMAVGYRKEILIRDIAISVKRGEIVTLIGPNGAGKSTILKSILRRIPLISGEVRLCGEAMGEMADGEVARRVSILMTDRLGTELMSGREVAATGRYPYTGRLGILSPADWGKVEEALAAVHAAEFGNRDFDKLSDGQRQRILLARALCQEPELLVMDEPTAYLDIYHKIEFLTLLQQLARRNHLAVLLSLHELELAQRVSDRVICVKGDTIYAVGTPDEIFRPEVVCGLYDLPRERYIEGYAAVEFAAIHGNEKAGTFVICGGGTGIPVFRRLQREGRAFAAGILQENDLDYPAARALAEQVVSVGAYEPIGDGALREAEKLLEDCREAICTLAHFGTLNKANEKLAGRARELGILYPTE